MPYVYADLALKKASSIKAKRRLHNFPGNHEKCKKTEKKVLR